MFHKTLCQGLRYGSAPLGNSVQSGGHHTLEMCNMFSRPCNPMAKQLMST